MTGETDGNPYLDQKLKWLVQYQCMRQAAKDKFPLSDPPTEKQEYELKAINKDLKFIADAIEYLVRLNLSIVQ